MARARSSTCGGIISAAALSTPSAPRSIWGRWKWSASTRLRPPLVSIPTASPSSTIAWAIEPVPARERTWAKRSRGTRPVVSIRSATSSLTGFGEMPAPGGGVGSTGGLSSGARGPRRFWRSSNSPWTVIGLKPPHPDGWRLEEREVGAQDVAAEEERDEGAEREERTERDGHLARRETVAGEEDERRAPGREHADHEPDDDGLAERRAEEEGELDVAHPHAARVGDQREEEEERGPERGEHPFERPVGVQSDLRGEHDHRCR